MEKVPKTKSEIINDLFHKLFGNEFDSIEEAEEILESLEKDLPELQKWAKEEKKKEWKENLEKDVKERIFKIDELKTKIAKLFETAKTLPSKDKSGWDEWVKEHQNKKLS